MSSHMAPSVPRRATGPLRRSTFGMVVLLLVQFMVGIVTTLKTTVPAHHPGANPSHYLSGSFSSIQWALSHGGAALAVHTGLGIALVLAAVGPVVSAVRCARPSLAALSGFGGLAIVGAGFAGASFLDYRSTSSSLTMAGLFAVALLCYAGVLTALSRDR